MNILDFNKFLQFLEENKKKDLIIFGASTAGSILKNIIVNLGYEIKFFSDNNSDLWERDFEGIPVISPANLINNENRLIFIASSYYEEIMMQLAEHGLKKYKDYYNVMNFEKNASEKFQDDIELRNVVIKDIYSKIERGDDWAEAILDKRARLHGERVCEYPFIMDWFIKHNPKTILDCGSVLNNPIINDYIPTMTTLDFLNPGIEHVIRENTTYYKYELDQYDVEKRYELVTCFSTLEHIGFDNSRYGFDSYDLGWGWNESVDCIINSLMKLLNLVEKKGQLIVSVPYGKKEFVYLNREIRSSQIVNLLHIQKIESFFQARKDIQYELVFKKLTEDGWVASSADDDYEGYGEVGPGASGVLFIKVKKL